MARLILTGARNVQLDANGNEIINGLNVIRTFLPNTAYTAGDQIIYQEKLYVAINTFTTGAAFVNTDWSEVGTIDNVSDLPQSGAVTGQVLAWDGTEWAPFTIQEVEGNLNHTPQTIPVTNGSPGQVVLEQGAYTVAANNVILETNAGANRITLGADAALALNLIEGTPGAYTTMFANLQDPQIQFTYTQGEAITRTWQIPGQVGFIHSASTGISTLTFTDDQWQTNDNLDANSLADLVGFGITQPDVGSQFVMQYGGAEHPQPVTDFINSPLTVQDTTDVHYKGAEIARLTDLPQDARVNIHEGTMQLTSHLSDLRDGFAIDFSPTEGGAGGDITVGVTPGVFASAAALASLRTHDLVDWPGATSVLPTGTEILTDAELGVGQPLDSNSINGLRYNPDTRELTIDFDAGAPTSGLPADRSIIGKYSGDDFATATLQWHGKVITRNPDAEIIILEIISGHDYLIARGDLGPDGRINYNNNQSDREYVLQYLFNTEPFDNRGVLILDDNHDTVVRPISDSATASTGDRLHFPTVGRVEELIEDNLQVSYRGQTNASFTSQGLRDAFASTTQGGNRSLNVPFLDNAMTEAVGTRNEGFFIINGETLRFRLVPSGNTSISNTIYFDVRVFNIDITRDGDGNRTGVAIDFDLIGISDVIASGTTDIDYAGFIWAVEHTAEALDALQNTRPASLQQIDASWVPAVSINVSNAPETIGEYVAAFRADNDIQYFVEFTSTETGRVVIELYGQPHTLNNNNPIAPGTHTELFLASALDISNLETEPDNTPVYGDTADNLRLRVIDNDDNTLETIQLNYALGARGKGVQFATQEELQNFIRNKGEFRADIGVDLNPELRAETDLPLVSMNLVAGTTYNVQGFRYHTTGANTQFQLVLNGQNLVDAMGDNVVWTIPNGAFEETFTLTQTVIDTITLREDLDVRLRPVLDGSTLRTIIVTRIGNGVLESDLATVETTEGSPSVRLANVAWENDTTLRFTDADGGTRDFSGHSIINVSNIPLTVGELYNAFIADNDIQYFVEYTLTNPGRVSFGLYGQNINLNGGNEIPAGTHTESFLASSINAEAIGDNNDNSLSIYGTGTNNLMFVVTYTDTSLGSETVFLNYSGRGIQFPTQQDLENFITDKGAFREDIGVTGSEDIRGLDNTWTGRNSFTSQTTSFTGRSKEGIVGTLLTESPNDTNNPSGATSFSYDNSRSFDPPAGEYELGVAIGGALAESGQAWEQGGRTINRLWLNNNVDTSGIAADDLILIWQDIENYALFRASSAPQVGGATSIDVGIVMMEFEGNIPASAAIIFNGSTTTLGEFDSATVTGEAIRSNGNIIINSRDQYIQFGDMSRQFTSSDPSAIRGAYNRWTNLNDFHRRVRLGRLTADEVVAELSATTANAAAAFGRITLDLNAANPNPANNTVVFVQGGSTILTAGSLWGDAEEIIFDSLVGNTAFLSATNNMLIYNNSTNWGLYNITSATTAGNGDTTKNVTLVASNGNIQSPANILLEEQGIDIQQDLVGAPTMIDTNAIVAETRGRTIIQNGSRLSWGLADWIDPAMIARNDILLTRGFLLPEGTTDPTTGRIQYSGVVAGFASQDYWFGDGTDSGGNPITDAWWVSPTENGRNAFLIGFNNTEIT